MKAYHFLKDNMCGGYGKERAWKIGEEREVKGKLKMCQWGYHASPSFYNALSYAQGNMACIVELSGEIQKDTDKYVAQKRKLIDARNAEKVLGTWACDCVERGLKRAKVEDERSWNAIKVTRLYNDGRATKKELAAARDAAWEATWAARDAATYAARDATRAAWEATWAVTWAARDAATYASRAARDAAWDAADRDAADRDAEIRWQKRRLNKYMRELFNG